jgi:enoyl-CoA hydratase
MPGSSADVIGTRREGDAIVRHPDWEVCVSAVQLSWPSERVALLLVDNGPRNFITWRLNDEIEAALLDIADEAAVVILGSAVDGFFLAHGHLGDNVETFTGGTPTGDPTSGLRVWKLLDTGPFVSIAAIDGQAWGGGAEYAWSCDLRVASTASTFAQVEVRLGVTGVCAATRLSRLAGEAAAKAILLDGRPIAAGEAHRLGLVHRLVAPGEAVGAAVEWGRWLASHPPGALATTKAAINAVRDVPLKEALEREVSSYITSFSAPDALERARAAQAAYDDGATSATVFGVE